MKTKFLNFCLGFYAGLLFYIFFLARRRPHPSLFKYSGHVNFIPFKDKYWYFRHQMGLPKAMVVEAYKDLFGNILLFVPIPFFLFFLAGRSSLRSTILVAATISFSVELTQFLLSIGTADIDDLILNILGAVVGYFGAKKMKNLVE